MIMNQMQVREGAPIATNLLLGAIYINTLSGQPCRLVNIVPCQGAWLESYDGSGYGVTVKFENVAYASPDEVQDYREDLRVYEGKPSAPSHKTYTFTNVISNPYERKRLEERRSP